jgi:hypothetical protein
VSSNISAGDLEKDNHDASPRGVLEKEDKAVPTPAATQGTPTAIQPPNGGLEAWLFVLAGFFIFVNSW